MKIAIYPGSFDPVTNGHLDIMKRASKLVDMLIVGVLINHKKTPLFSAEERVKMLEEATSDLPNVQIRTFEGLTVDFAREVNAGFIIRGLRAISDFDYELQMAHTNGKLYDDIDTIFLPAGLEYAYLSSTTVKEVASFGGDISQFVPPMVAERITRKQQTQRGE